jgi:pimeloyl-ACP methyl ester carboxylesterase
MARSEQLGEVHEVAVPGGRLRYREVGEGEPVVFVHGLLVNGDLWRAVVPTVAAAGYRCLTPDWPLGAHEVPVPDADLSPPGVAAMIADFLAALDLTGVTIVANDTGGALTQVLLASRPERVARVVLTSCDAFERFFPPMFTPLTWAARVPGLPNALIQSMRVRALQRLPIAFGWVAKRPVPPEIADSYLLPSRRDRAIRRDLVRFLRGVDRRHTLAAAARLGSYGGQVLLVWAREDKLFPVSLAERLAGAFPAASLEFVDDCYTFIPEDQPAELARRVVTFLGAHAAA